VRKNAVTHNPVKGVKRPKHDSPEGRTPALGDYQARKLLAASDDGSLRNLLDWAILATYSITRCGARNCSN
jgi:integrase/recombinase XerD